MATSFEFLMGMAAQGLRNVAQLIAIVRDAGDLRLPDMARQVLQVLAAQLEHIEAAIAALEKQLMAWHNLWFMVRAPCLQKGPVPGLAARAFRDDCHCCPVRPIEKPRSNKPRI